jgi:hypothetical protein
MDEKDMIKHYKWFCDSCKKRKIKPISYSKYKKELLGTIKKNNTPEGKERLENISKALNNSIQLLK